MVIRFNPANATTKEDMDVPMPTLAQLKEITGGQPLSVEEAAEIMDSTLLHRRFSEKVLKPGERTTICSRFIDASRDPWLENHQYADGRPPLEIGYGSASNNATPVLVLWISGRDTVKKLRRRLSQFEEMTSDLLRRKSPQPPVTQFEIDSLARRHQMSDML